MELENIVANTVYLKARESGGGKNRGKSRKWKQLLALPPVTHCLHIKDQIPLTFKYVYEEQPIGKLLFRQYCQTSLPAGSDPTLENQRNDINPYWNYILFLDAVSDFDLADLEDKERLRKELIRQYLTPSSGSYVFRTETGIDPQLSEFVDEESLSELMREIDSCEQFQKSVTLPSPLPSANTNGLARNMAVLLPGSDVRPKEPLETAEPPNPFALVSSLVNERLSATPFQDFVASKYFERYLQFKYLELQPVTKNTFRMYRILGKGGFGEVCACQVRATGKMYACKKMEKKRIKKRKAETMALNEKNILTKVNSRFVVSLTYAFEAKDSLCLVLTLMNGGDLKFHIHSLATPMTKAAAKTKTLTSAVYRRPSGMGPGPQGGTIIEAENGADIMTVPVKQRSSFPANGPDDYRQAGPGGFEPDRARFYAAEIATGLAHLHGLRVAYRIQLTILLPSGYVHALSYWYFSDIRCLIGWKKDLKPENILLDDEGHVRISDMGLGIEIPAGSLISGRVGTIGYMAPEVVKDKKYAYGPDWFSLGCLIYEMIDGKSPFRARKEKVNRQEINRRVLSEIEAYNSRFIPEARDLCLRLMDKDPETRIGVMPGTECKESDPLSVLNHPYFTTHLNMAQLKAGKIPPPFIPDPRAVYCKDILDIDQFSTVKGVVLDNEDESYYKKFNTGSVSIPWQNEMIETDCFKDLNIFSQENLNSADLLPTDLAAAEAEEKRNESLKSGPAKSFWARIFGRKICCDDDDFFD